MVANYTPRDFTFTVDGKDCTNLLFEVSGGYSPLAQNGLFLLQADFTLKLTPEFDETFDDRVNFRWNAGKPIDYFISGERAPLIGTTLIESSEYDGLQTLKIKAAGYLSLFNSLTSNDLGVCVELDRDMAHTVAVTTLLNKAGIPEENIRLPDIPGSIKTPLSVQGGQSLIALAGQISFSNGKMLYQDNQGIIRAIDYSNTNQGLVYSDFQENLIRYERLYEAQLPPKKILLSGTTSIVQNNLENLDKTFVSTRQIDITPDSDGNRLFTRRSSTEKTTKEVSYNEEDRTVEKKEQVLGPIGAAAPSLYPGRRDTFLINRDTTLEEYETITQPDPTPLTANIGSVPNEVSVKPLTECINRDPGRILRRVTRSEAPRSSPLEDYMNIRKTVEEGDTIIGDLAIGTWKIVTEEWEYNLNELPDETVFESTFSFNNTYSNLVQRFGSVSGSYGAVTVETVTYTRTSRVWIGSIFPDLAAIPWGKADEAFPEPTQYVTEESEISTWSKTDRNSDVWNRDRKVYRNKYLEAPELINAMINDDSIVASSVLEAVSTLRTIENSLESNTQPPNFGTFPAVLREKNDPYRIEITLDSPLVIGNYDKTLAINMGSFPADRTLAQTLAGEWGRILWQRSKGQLITTNLAIVPSNIRPLLRVDIQERDGTVASYGVDAPQIGISKVTDGVFQAAFSFTGIYQGKSTDPQALNQPIPAPEPVEIPSTDGVDVIFPVLIITGLNDAFPVTVSGLSFNIVIPPGTYNDAQEIVDILNTQIDATGLND